MRTGARALIACATVAGMAVLATWHSSGLVRRGEIDRMLRMSANAPKPVVADQKSRGRLDRGRMNSLMATAAK